MATLGRLAVHATNYSIVSVLVTIAGLISFPILTRLMSVDDYGLMSLVALLLSLVIAIGKLGLQHAVLRFYSEVQAGKRADMPTFVATAVLGMGLIGLLVTTAWAVATQLVPRSWWSDTRIPALLLLTSVLVLVRVVDSAWVNQLRAQERSAALAVYSVARRYAVLGATLITLFFISRSLWGFYVAIIVIETLSLFALGVVMLRADPIYPSRFSPQLLRAMMAFGAPMIGTELSSVLLAMGDRYVIQLYLGAEPLGVYAAAYNLCDYIKGILFVSLTAAALPMVLRTWEEHGADHTRQFLMKFFRIYFLVAFPAVAGIAAVSEELLSVLASPRYREGAVVMPIIIAAMALEALVVTAGAGLYIMKRTRTILALIAAAAVLSVGLNVLLVPRIGIEGAALALLTGWAALAIGSFACGARYLVLAVPWHAAAKFGTLALVMYGVVHTIELQEDAATLLARVILGIIIYVAGVLLVDRAARLQAHQLMSRVSAWSRST